jgi:hypothetical protein
MADNYQAEKYLTILGILGPSQSLVLIDKLMIDLKISTADFMPGCLQKHLTY